MAIESSEVVAKIERREKSVRINWNPRVSNQLLKHFIEIGERGRGRPRHTASPIFSVSL
jgi:hypothetical protein